MFNIRSLYDFGESVSFKNKNNKLIKAVKLFNIKKLNKVLKKYNVDINYTDPKSGDNALIMAYKKRIYQCYENIRVW